MRAPLLASALGLVFLAGCATHDPSPPRPATEPPAGGGGSEPSTPLPPVPPSPFTCKIEPDLPAPEGPAKACAEAIVALGAPREVRIDVETTRAVRVEAAIDAAGTIAHYASWGNGGGGYWVGDLALVRLDGMIAHPAAPGTSPVLDARFVLVTAGREGFLAVDAIGELTFFGSDGATVRHSRIPWPGELASVFAPYGYGGLRGAFPDGRGGAFVALVGAGAGGEGAALWVAHVGPDGAVVAPPFTVVPLPSEAISSPYAPAQALGTVAVGEDGDGRILVTWDGGWAGCGNGTIAGRWFLPDGTPLGDVFRAGAGLPLLYPYWFTDARLVPLHDGSLALRRDDGTWTRRFTKGALAGGPAPGWLAARPGEEVTSRGDGLLVFRRPAAEDGSGGRVDVVDGAGAVCAHVDLPGESPTRQTIPRARMTPAVGLDGTIVQLADVENDPLGTSVLRVWPGGLR